MEQVSPVTVSPVQIGDYATLYQADCLAVLRSLPDDSVDLILTDPPYFRVKTEDWDRQWESANRFLDWLGELCVEWQRILKRNGSLYVFASPQMQARVECKIAERFAILNNIIWRKPTGRHLGHDLSTSRGFFPQTERLIFAEHPNSDNVAKGVAGYHTQCDRLRGFVFESIRVYLDSERKRAGLTPKQVNDHLGSYMAGHYFGTSQWTLPTEPNYQKLRQIFNEHGQRPAPPIEEYHPADGLWRKYSGTGTSDAYLQADHPYLAAEYEYLRTDYDYLRADYEELRQTYELLRRPFSISRSVPYTDVWDYPPVMPYKGRHPCEKPLAMMMDIIRASSRPGAVVLDCFFGSGVTGEAARRLDRKFIGMEKDPGHFARGQARIEQSPAYVAPASPTADEQPPEQSPEQLPEQSPTSARRSVLENVAAGQLAIF